MTINDVIGIHKILIDRFGGSHGLRDQGALNSALQRPFTTFDGIELYQSTEEKAAALIESILINHPFIDGNKRIGYTIMRLLLLSYNKDIRATEDEKYSFVVGIASGELKYKSILEWISSKLVNV